MIRFSKTYPSLLTIKEGVLLKSSRPSLPLKKAPPLISVFSPQARRRKPPSGARNRYAIRLADHQRSRHIVRDGTALLRYILYLALSLIYMDQQKEKTSYIYYCLLINFAANSKKSATVLKLSNCWQYILA